VGNNKAFNVSEIRVLDLDVDAFVADVGHEISEQGT
jgi:hypothetical protein